MTFTNTVSVTCGTDNILEADQYQSQPFKSFATNATNDIKSSETGFTPAHTSKRSGWGSSSIWGSATLSSGYNTRDVTRDTSASRSSRPSSRDEEVIEGKTGSGSLVESSVSDDLGFRATWGAKRNLPTQRSMSQAQYTQASTVQPRSVSNAGLPLSMLSATQNAMSFNSRPAPSNLDTKSSLPSTNGYVSGYAPGFPGRYSDQPPTVYPKHNRPGDLNLKRGPDSAKEGLWTNASPFDERKSPTYNAFNMRTASTPAYRNNSGAGARNDEQCTPFSTLDHSRSAQRTTHNSSRAPSTSSQSNTALNGFADASPDHLACHLTGLNINGQPYVPPKGSFGSSALFRQFSPTSTVSPFAQPIMSSMNLGTTAENSPSAMDYLNNNGFTTSQQADTYLEYAANGLGGQEFGSPDAAHLSCRQPFANGTGPGGQRLMDSRSGANLTQGWAQPELRMSTNGRLSIFQDQNVYPQYRLEQQMLPPQLRIPFQQVYDPITLQQAIQLNGAVPYVPLLHNGMPSVNSNDDCRSPTARAGESYQSMLMYEFKSNSKSRRYELKDIYNHIAEFSGDQHGSRFIQIKLETANSDEKEQVFKEIEENAIQLMTDVFGNYVIQKFFEHGDQRHKRILANKMKGEVVNLSVQMYGCRVVQKALEHVLRDQQHVLVAELDGSVLRCVRDQNGNHVVQKAIERCRSSSIDFIFQAFRGEVQSLSTHCYGCRVIQRCLERCEPGPQAMIMEELMVCIEPLITDQYGNYVVQHIIENDDGQGKQLVLDVVGRNLEAYSKHKGASNVVEKCLLQADDMWIHKIFCNLASNHLQRPEGDGIFVSMAKDQYGNYVIRKSTMCS